jgi:hypothetical protein
MKVADLRCLLTILSWQNELTIQDGYNLLKDREKPKDEPPLLIHIKNPRS